MSDDDIETLRRRMAVAVAAEDYEAAARLRDQIAARQGKGAE
ncbi:MAG: UvrB/UvrC motif-containing protein, partial [Phenylobacterium sp.]